MKSIVHINGKLYLRDNKDAENPIKIVDKDTLEVVKDSNLRKIIEEKRRKKDEDPWNLPIYEVTLEEDFNSVMEQGLPEPQRRVSDSVIFTEGKHIYIIATYYERKDVDHYEVEMYDPETLNFIKSVKLILEPDTESIESTARIQDINDHTETLKNAMMDNLKGRVNFMTNGSVLCINITNKLYFFSMETGLRSPDYVHIDGVYS